MNKIRIAAAVSLAVLLSSGAFAQAPAPAAPAAAAPAASAPVAAPAMDRKAKAAQCIAEANQKGLHGKARKHFKSKCKRGTM